MAIQVEIEALRRDARTWAGGEGSMAHTMRAAATSGDTALRVTPQQLSFAGQEVGLDQTYEQLRAKAVRLMGEAAANFEAVAGALTRAADEYERTDGRADQAIRDAWQIREDD